MGACAPESTRKPAAFEPVREQLLSGDRIARCNTVHSLTLPPEILQRYELSAGEDLAFISCSLQIATQPPSNIPARVSGTQTALTGSSEELQFKEVLDRNAVSYIAPFDLTATSELRFDVQLADPDTNAVFDVQLRQAELSGRA